MRLVYSKEQTKAAIERRDNRCVPVCNGLWWGNGLAAKYGDALKELAQQYPEDICMAWYQGPGNELGTPQNPEYRYGYLDYSNARRHSIGQSAVLLPSWDELDVFLAHFPDPNEPDNFAGAREAVKKADGRYVLGCWWRLFHEWLWGVRGMENLMLDYYDNMDGLMVLGRRVLEFYKVIIARFAALGCDGIFTSDDLGHQRGPMMSPAIFEALYFPLYQEVVAFTHQHGMHFFLHSCGDNTLLMEYLVAAGVDVFHPVQKGCMDMASTAHTWGGKISFLAGVDVQDLLVNAAPERVRAEVREMKALFGKPGGLLLGMGNGILPDSPLENIRAALDEMHA